VGAVLALLLLLFTTVPLLELALLLWIGSHVGVVPTIALILSTGVLGAALARHQGLATLRRFQDALGRGRLPERELIEGLLILIAAAVLLTPGVLTDITGFLLLVPPIRHLVAARIGRSVRRRLVVSSPGGSPPGSPRRPPRPPQREDDVIDADFEVLDGDDRRP